MLEDLFKVVKQRFNDDTAHEDDLNKTDQKEMVIYKCPRCQNAIPQDDFISLNKICPKCNYHGRLTAKERLNLTVDKGSFTEFDSDMISRNPINFPEYDEKQADLREKTGLKDAVVTGEATIRGIKVIIAVMDSHYMMASMGSVVGEKITRAFETASERKLPVIVFTASGGARMQEGVVSLMQMAKTSGAVAKLGESHQLFISVLTDPTTGGVTASFASLGDIIIAEPKALIGFAGRRVIEGTIKQHLPDDFQLAEFLMDKGFVDMIVERKKMRSTLSNLLRLHGYSADEV
jgi:acetyl-CoA carboxylase carboxyl transferase subunit beta